MIRYKAGWCALQLTLWLSASASCAHPRASAVADAPPLDVPPAPPRISEPVDTETPQPMPLVEEPARHAPARSRPSSSRPETQRNEPQRPEGQPAPPPSAEPARPVEDASKTPPTLQTTPPGAEGEMERIIRQQLQRASNDLGRIDYRALSADAKTQYDTAKRFVQQADEALHARNLVFAKTVADKAAALAAQLAGR